MRELTPGELYQHANKTIGVAIDATRLGDNVRAVAARLDAKQLRSRAAELTRKVGS